MNKLFKQISCILLLICSVLVSQVVSARDDSWQQIEKKKEIIIGLDETFVPMGFTDTDGTIVGFDIDLAKAVFDGYGIKVKFQPIEWIMKESELNNKTIDLIWNGYSVNESRKKKVLFSKPYMQNDQVIVALKSSGINKFSDMKDKVLVTQTASSSEDNLNAEPEKLLNYIKNKKPVSLDNFNMALIELNSKRAAGILVDKIYADYYISKQKNPEKYTTAAEGGFEPEQFAVGIRKNDVKLKEKIDQAFDKLYKDGVMQKISKKWFGKDLIIAP